MNDDKIKPLPCPFCGSEAEVFETHMGDGEARCHCPDCPIGFTANCEEYAIKLWNRRPIAQEEKSCTDDKIKPVRAWAAIGAGGMYEFGLDKEYLYVATSKDENFEKVVEVEIRPIAQEVREEGPARVHRYAEYFERMTKAESQLSALTKENAYLKRLYSDQIDALTQENKELKEKLEAAKRI